MGDNQSIDGSVQQSVSSVGTDRASNHGNLSRALASEDARQNAGLSSSPPIVSALPVPTTVVAISGGIEGEAAAVVDGLTNGIAQGELLPGETLETVKLTAEALAMANNQQTDKSGRNMFGILEVSSNLSRSSSESALQTSSHKNGGIPSQVKVMPNLAENGECSSGNETPAHFQPWEQGSVASSLGDPLQIPVAAVETIQEVEGRQCDTPGRDKRNDMLTKELSELATAVHLATETPPKANLSSSKDDSNTDSTTFSIGTPNASPTKTVLVDATLASTLPPMSPPMTRSVPNSPMPASAMRTGSANSSLSPSIHRPNHTRKATFQEPTLLIRTSSNASSSTTATNASTTKRIRIGVCAMDKKVRNIANSPFQHLTFWIYSQLGHSSQKRRVRNQWLRY